MLSSLISGSGAPDLTSFSALITSCCFADMPADIRPDPAKARRYTLLALSFGFYWLVSGKLIIYLLLSIFSAHYFGLWLDRIISKRTEALKEAEKEQRKEIKRHISAAAEACLPSPPHCISARCWCSNTRPSPQRTSTPCSACSGLTSASTCRNTCCRSASRSSRCKRYHTSSTSTVKSQSR